MPTTLLERDAAVAALRNALDDATVHSRGRVLAIEGPPGIGKTRLLAELRGLATERGTTVLSARGSELERDHGFGVVRQLFEPLIVAGRGEELLQGAAVPAGAVVGGPDAPPPAGDPSLPVLHGLYWLAANLTAEGPVVLLIDDAHWADAASLRWLHYLERRIEGMPLLVAIAARSAEPGADRALLDAVLDDASIGRIEVPPLSVSATKRIVTEALGITDDGVVTACHDVTRGNPFLLSELLTQLGTEPESSPPKLAKLVRGLGIATISRAVLARVARLGEHGVRLARAAAVLGDGAPLREVAALCDLPLRASVQITDALVDTHVFASADPVTFVHAIVRTGIYGDIGDAQRSEMHAEAVEQLMAGGASPDRIASHILRSSPAGRAPFAEHLAQAAGAALQRGAPDAATVYLQRALDEPPPAAMRPVLLQMLGMAEMSLFHPDAAKHLDEARSLSTDGGQRAEIARMLALFLTMSARLPEAVELLDGAIEEVAPVDEQAAMAMEAVLINVARVDPSLWPIARRRTDALAARLGSSAVSRTPAERLALVQVAVEATSVGRPAVEVAEIAQQAWADGKLLAEEGPESPPVVLAALVLLFADRFDEAKAVLDAVFDDAITRGSPAGAAHALCFRAHVHHRIGSIAEAEADARTSIDAVDVPQPLIFPMQVAVLVDALIDRGDAAAAQEVLERYGFDGPVSGLYHDLHLLCSRSRLRRLQGRADDALADALLAGERHEAWGMPNPAILAWRSAAAYAYLASDDRAAAAHIAREELELARGFGAARANGIALRALASASNGDERLDLLLEAATVLEPSPARAEYARVLTDLGGALRRANRRSDAREPLTQAIDVARRCGATAIVDDAMTELRATGAKPRRLATTGVESLTPSELRVAKMATQGLRNREIAQQLFVTVKTVEDHLGHAYAKLGIRSREELVPRLSP